MKGTPLGRRSLLKRWDSDKTDVSDRDLGNQCFLSAVPVWHMNAAAFWVTEHPVKADLLQGTKQRSCASDDTNSSVKISAILTGSKWGDVTLQCVHNLHLTYVFPKDFLYLSPSLFVWCKRQRIHKECLLFWCFKARHYKTKTCICQFWNFRLFDFSWRLVI